MDSQPALQLQDSQAVDSHTLMLNVLNCIEVCALFILISTLFIYLKTGASVLPLERGLCQAVSGDNPTSPVVTFDLLRDRCACSM